MSIESTPLSTAEAWCWAARLYNREADAIDYAWPPVPNAYEQSEPLHEESRAMHARAVKLDPSDDLWVRAMEKWDANASEENRV